MDLLAVLRVAVQRWYILVPLLVLSVFSSWGVAQQVKPTYEIQGILTVSAPYVASEDDAKVLAGNTFLDYTNTANIMAALADSPQTRSMVEAKGFNPDYKVLVQGSVVTATVSEDSPERSLAAYRLIAETIRGRLDTLQAQAGVPPGFRIVATDVLQPQGAQEVLGNRQRVLIASAALGGVLSIAVCVFVDYLLTRRQ
ncbi:MAG TPA: hypothetical protein VFQ77_03110 [Pseudonocardiaceae bacterium]|jgi:hypothetical protein|nr:hypothetical protein [Pseudonocardiaceae bacterium]